VHDNRNPVVDEWFESYDNPQKALVQAVREVVLDTDPRVQETIKWKAPTFMFEGNIASFYPRPRQRSRCCSTPVPHCPTRTGCWRARATPPGWHASLTQAISVPSARVCRT
jgi:hypothetical protein